jgi:hypothetical protein
VPFIFHLLDFAQASLAHQQIKNAPHLRGIGLCFGGERGIRTPGGLTLNGFQDRRNRPLCHLSDTKIRFMIKPEMAFLDFDSHSII